MIRRIGALRRRIRRSRRTRDGAPHRTAQHRRRGSMESDLVTPTAEQLVGHWYLAGMTAGFLDARPRVLMVEVKVEPLPERRVRLIAAVTTVTRRILFSHRMSVATERSSLSYGLLSGKPLLMRKWRIGHTPDGSVLRAAHEGSLLVGGGVLLYVRYPMTEEQAKERITAQADRLKLSTRELETMRWPERPVPELDGSTPAPPSDGRLRSRLAHILPVGRWRSARPTAPGADPDDPLLG